MLWWKLGSVVLYYDWRRVATRDTLITILTALTAYTIILLLGYSLGAALTIALVVMLLTFHAQRRLTTSSPDP